MKKKSETLGLQVYKQTSKIRQSVKMDQSLIVFQALYKKVVIVSKNPSRNQDKQTPNLLAWAFTLLHPLHSSLSCRIFRSASTADLHPTFSCTHHNIHSNILAYTTPWISRTRDRHSYGILKNGVLITKSQSSAGYTWISGRSTRMNGLVSNSSPMVEGTVGRPVFLFCSAHANFCDMLTLSGSTVEANCKFFFVYCTNMFNLTSYCELNENCKLATAE